MYSECGLYAVMSSPPKNAALNSVVANWLIPPPKESLNTPSSITCASTKPLASVRGPMNWFTENVSPGRITCPRMRSAMRWMFFTRSSPALCFVVNDPIGCFTFRPVTLAVVIFGVITVRSSVTGCAISPLNAFWMRSTVPGAQHSRPSTEGTAYTVPVPSTVSIALCALRTVGPTSLRMPARVLSVSSESCTCRLTMVGVTHALSCAASIWRCWSPATNWIGFAVRAVARSTRP